MIIEIQHETTLQYSESIKEWLAEVRMEPISDERQTCHSFHVAVSQPTQVYRYLDGFGNRVHHFNLVAPHQQIRVLAASVVCVRGACASSSTLSRSCVSRKEASAYGWSHPRSTSTRPSTA